MDNERLAKLRSKVAYSRGLRKIRAEAELVENLAHLDNNEALRIAEASAKRARTLLQNVTERGAETSEYEINLAWILRANAFALRALKNYEQAITLIDEVIELFRKTDEVDELLTSNYIKHLIYRDQRRHREALEVVDEALLLAALTRSHTMSAPLKCARGTLLGILGDFQGAEAAFEDALADARRSKDTYDELVVLNDYGTFQEERGRPEKSRELLRRLIDLEEEFKLLGDRNRSNAYWNVFRILTDIGQVEEARKYARLSIDTATAAGLDLRAASYKTSQAVFFSNQFECERAIDYVLDALLSFEAYNKPEMMAYAHTVIGIILCSLGEEQAARPWFKEAASVYNARASDNAFRDADEIVSGIAGLALYKYDGLDVQASIKYYRELLSRHSSSLASRAQGLRLGLSRLLLLAGLNTEAQEHLQRAFEDTKRIGYTLKQIDAEFNLLTLELQLGRTSAAREKLIELSERSLRTRRLVSYRKMIEVLAKLDAEAESPAAGAGATAGNQWLKAIEELHSEVALDRQRFYVNWKLEQYHNRKLSAKLQETQSRLEVIQDEKAVQAKILAARVAQVEHLSERFKNFSRSLRQFKSGANADKSENLTKLITMAEAANYQEPWQEFARESHQQDEEFLRRLSEKFPTLTNAERKVCALIRINHTTQDLCRLLDISPRSVQSYRYRIRKKLGISGDVDLRTYILDLF